VKTWLLWLAVGVLLASVISGVFGVGAMAAFGIVPMEAFSTAFFGWVFGDIIVLSTVGTVIAIVLTSLIVKSRLHVRNFFS
jgi:integral membrane sensor domain MASE1